MEASAPSEKPVHAGGNAQRVASMNDFTSAGSVVPTKQTAKDAALAQPLRGSLPLEASRPQAPREPPICKPP